MQDIDIVMFPEDTLTPWRPPVKSVLITEVPVPNSEIVCNSLNPKYRPFLKQLSCSAVKRQTTLVVNLVEKENCTQNPVVGFCPSGGLIYYNSDIVLNEHGTVSAK